MFIKLTDKEHGIPVYLWPCPGMGMIASTKSTYVSTREFCNSVEETPEEIMKLAHRAMTEHGLICCGKDDD